MSDVLETNLEIDMEPLQQQVRMVGSLLGEVLKEQEGEGCSERRKYLRRGYISLRHEDDPAKRQQLKEYKKP